MNCREFWEQDPEALDHLKECSACAARYARHHELGARLRGLGAEMRHVEAPARVEKRLLAAFRGQAVFAPTPAARRAGWVAPAAWAAAVAATVMAGFALFHGQQPQPNRRVVRKAIEVAALEPAESVDPAATLADGFEDFIPLPNAERIAANEQVNMVRVEVLRSAMIPLGYAVSEEHASDTVEADVVLGADGQARAVRFLGEASNF
jgi:anti-sigma factor RsiW